MEDSYYSILGLTLPIIARVRIEKMPGLNYYILWVDNGNNPENILYSHLSGKDKALKIIDFHKWELDIKTVKK